MRLSERYRAYTGMTVSAKWVVITHKLAQHPMKKKKNIWKQPHGIHSTAWNCVQTTITATLTIPPSIHLIHLVRVNLTFMYRFVLFLSVASFVIIAYSCVSHKNKSYYAIWQGRTIKKLRHKEKRYACNANSCGIDGILRLLNKRNIYIYRERIQWDNEAIYR